MSFAAAFAATFVVALGYGVLAPLAPGLAAAHMGSDEANYAFHIGAVTGTYLLAFAASAPLWGRHAEGRHRNRLAAMGLMGMAFALAATGFVASAPALYLGAGIAGAAAGAIAPAVQTGATLQQGSDGKVRFLTLLGAASFAGWFLGPVLAAEALAPGSLIAAAPWAVLLFVAALAVLTAASCAAEGEAQPARAYAAALPAEASAAWTFPALTFAVAFGLGAFEISLILWGRRVLGMEAAFMARMLLECTVVMALTQAALVFVPAARPRWNSRGAATLFVLLAAAVAANALWPRTLTAVASVAAFAVLATILQAMLSLGTVETAGAQPGRRIGLQLSLNSAGQGGGSLAAAAVFGVSGNSFWIAAFLLASAAALAWLRPVRIIP